jgi:hypothetical protein
MTIFLSKGRTNMKRFTLLLTSALVAGFCLTACGNLAPMVPTIAPSPTISPVATLANPTATASPTLKVQPSTTPTATSLPGTAMSFDRLSLVVPTGLAAGGSGALVPEAKGDDIVPLDVAPEHIQFKLGGYALKGKLFEPQICVYPAQAYADLQEFGAAAQSLERLRAVLAQSSMVNVKELPAVPFFNVSRVMVAQVKVIPFQGGRGVRVVTEYAMARAVINNHELIYHFEGLTDDGQFYVIAILPVTAPGLPEDGKPGSVVPPGGVAVPDFNDVNANWMGYYGDARQMLQGLEPVAFSPNLNQLDALIGSLTLATSN